MTLAIQQVIVKRTTYVEHREHGLCDVEGVSPVVVCHRAIVLLHTQCPATEDLHTADVATLTHTSPPTSQATHASKQHSTTKRAYHS